VVREKPGRVVLILVGSFPKKHERPGDGIAFWRLPFASDFLVGFPSALCHGALEQAVPGSFSMSKFANFALRGNSHELKPGAYQEALVEGQLDERPYLLWACVVPDFGDHLGGGGVPEVEPLNEGEHVGGVHRLIGVLVPLFGGVAKERGVPKWRGGLPTPLPWVPREGVSYLALAGPWLL